ncbi:MAG: metallophosphoesterase [Propionicimonas sp.]
MIGKLAVGLAAGAAACVGYGTFIESGAFRVRRVRVPVLPPGAPKVRVLHVSDVHLYPGQRRKLAFVSNLAALEPDLVVSTGDNIAHPEALEPLLGALGRLLDAPGVFVFGSNDYSGPGASNPLGYLARSTSRHGLPEDRKTLPTEALRAGLSAGGWRDVNTSRATLEIRGLRVEFRGTDDAHLHRDDYSRVAGPPSDGTDLSVGVTHAPYLRVIDAMAADGVPLVFAGHTHGGQVCVPLWGALTTNCDLPPARAKGLSPNLTDPWPSPTTPHPADDAEPNPDPPLRWSGLWRPRAAGASGPDGAANPTSWLHVSAGVGSSPFAPYRFACPPEVTLLTLVPASNG